MSHNASEKDFQQSVQQFVEKEIAPDAHSVDQAGTFPWKNFHALAKQGYFGLHLPTRYGGQGANLLDSAVVVEKVAAACASTSTLLCTQALATYSILLSGNEEQKKHYLTPLAKGKVPGAFAVTEAEAGSDVANIQTSAKKHANGYMLQGRKRFISNGGEAKIYIVLAKTNPERGAKGLSLFLVEADQAGFSFGEKEQTMGVRGAVTRELIFDQVQIPEHHRLGDEGDGFGIIMNVFNRSRTLVGAQAVGIAQGALNYIRSYLKKRKQFGKPLSHFQLIQNTLAEMATEIEAARLLVRQAAQKIDQGEQNVAMYASMAKSYASDVAMKVTTEAVQLAGGYGYTQKAPLERMMRDAKVTQIYDGTNQIQRIIIARQLLKD